ncbi:hypothetical protein MPSEU_000444500 [Mayamaea pseudoterrestris]|nr:hypothetical protein MPSEU_000444500 [Mayamaea pseudoterrestris]
MHIQRMRNLLSTKTFSSRRCLIACSGATTVVLLSTTATNAFVAPSSNHNVLSNSRVQPRETFSNFYNRYLLEDAERLRPRFIFGRLSMTSCDSANMNVATTNTAAKPQQQIHRVDTSIYEYIEPPPRALMESHAVLGALLENDTAHGGGIRSFDVYKNIHPNDDEVVMSIVQLGNNLDGHKGQVHGGILALLIDDTLGYAAIEGLDVPYAVTANLNVNYRAGVPAGSTICIRAVLVERKERKMVWKVVVERWSDDDNEAVAATLYCEASSVFVIPRNVYEEMIQSEEKVA